MPDNKTTKNKPISKFLVFDQNNIGQFNEEDQKEILEDFVKDIGEKITKIQNNNNVKEIKLILHLLRQSAGSIGAEKLWEYIKQIEESFKNNELFKNKGWQKELLDLYEEFAKEAELFLSNTNSHL
jgi:HPt (histidine-containing phosphotransfer) domain-containing protein